ncbi:FHA domain-containing protein [Alteromonas stellipolaris]|uniref:FHA domain-containing protein n=1 Tax=Alteromonas stellipolaris TaxID=233316 RepID=UPI0027370E5C|nr:FHA domain-containing protein [Alteromonas stellipolaris]MDP2535959.1 FHA domain-containing protein [Alteromonas stellipolaris]
MAIKRGPDGVPVDMPSVIVSGDTASKDTAPTEPETRASGMGSNTANDGPTVTTPSNATPVNTVPSSTSPSMSATSGLIFDEPPTTPANRHPSTTPDESVDIRENAGISEHDDIDALPTVIGGNRRPSAPPVSTTETAAQSPHSMPDPMQDPISGWLVVVKGPGKGHFLKLGFGQNSIGRSASERVCVDFGDGQVSRVNHATISYDPRGNQFYIQPGSGTNMTYLDNQPAPVLQPMILPAFSHISIGETTLRFVPLCGENFTWESMEED